MAEVNEKLARALEAMRRSLGVRDVLTNGRGTIWVLAGPRTLRRSLGPHGTVRLWLAAACPREDRWTVGSYLENAMVWDGWDSALSYGLHCLGIEGEWEIIPVPALTIPKKAWSARKGRWLPAGPRPRFRFCEQPSVTIGSAAGPVLIEVASDLPPLMLTHGVSKRKMAEVSRCGGLLWPSFALSWRVPEAYGDVVFFASTTAVTDLLKPSGSPDPNMLLVGSDIWSPDARELARLEKAIQWELSGDSNWWAGNREHDEGGWGRRDLQNDLLIEGLSQEDLVGRFSYFEDWRIVEPLRTRRQLVRRMHDLYAAYGRRGPYVYTERDPELRISDTPYPYGELKVTGKVELDQLPLVVYPRRIRKSVENRLDALAFRGVRLPISYAGPLHDEADEAQRRVFAGTVTREVLRWAQNPCHLRGAQVGEALRHESFRSSYDPVLWWVVGRQPTWRPGFCGDKDPGPRAAKLLSRSMREWLERKQADPARWGLELAAGLAELDDPEVAAWFAKAEQSRFLLSAHDARIGNARGWFTRPVRKGTEVVAVRLDTPWD